MPTLPGMPMPSGLGAAAAAASATSMSSSTTDPADYFRQVVPPTNQAKGGFGLVWSVGGGWVACDTPTTDKSKSAPDMHFSIEKLTCEIFCTLLHIKVD